MTKQRETLFNSPEEKQAEIEYYQDVDKELFESEKKLQQKLETIGRRRKEVICRIQDLQNLDMFDDS